ncbi:MAG: phage major capsid protein [Propionibacteriaceae bacterium]|nr:phage major capsid protein [Propionibacteriaceae bacterium]
MSYDQIIGTPDVAEEMMPASIATEIIQSATEQSVALTRARRTPMSSRVHKQPVLNSLPVAYWVNGDTGMKQASKADWRGITITAEEVATIIPIPDALVSDSNVPLWDQVRPLVAEAIGLKIDQAVLFGVDKPSSWPAGLVPAATAAGNVVEDTGTDFWKSVSELAEKIDTKGFAINAFACRPGLSWRLRGARDGNGRPIFDSQLNESGKFSLFGFPLDEVRNGAWDPEVADLLAIDWSKVILGVRQDITYDMFSEGVISDDDGKVVLNLMQQDTKALRVVTRVGYQVAVPMTRLGDGFPAGLITPASAGGGEP